MARLIPPSSWLLLMISFACTLHISCASGASEGDQKTYIVYMGESPKGDFSVSSLHMSMLQQVVGSSRASDSLLHSYKRSFNGFVAKLTGDERENVANMEGVVSVFPNLEMKLHTTRSWDFMGFPIEVNRTEAESDVIIGMLDTGIWPESDSFKDEGIGPPPAKWKGTCQASANFTCNNKIIGARYYLIGRNGSVGPGEFESPRDSEGHGSHTASTAAGAKVSQAGLLGLGLGTARGGVPSGRIAVYKICWSGGCPFADILAAFDDAIADGVDIISLSVGGFFPREYFVDPIAIGAFHAMKNGILTSNSAGNEGPGLGSITNFSPWTLSVAASTIDRKFITPVMLGNNKVYKGFSINTFDLNDTMYPLVSADVEIASVNGTIVLHHSLSTGQQDLEGGAIGTIMESPLEFAFSFPLPASALSPPGVREIAKYINSTSKPVATIAKSTERKDELAPYVISFSSRGPNRITNDILAPDLTAPGVDIVAAWSQATTVTGFEGDNRVVPYNIISGTSMSCPHASGVAAYVKSFNPSWSPAAIKSAMITTAFPMSATSSPQAEFAYGAGHINPSKAINPGLIYDLELLDYVKFLCGQGYNSTTVQLITGDNTTCSENATVWDLNLPSFALSTLPLKALNQTFKRTVTNVGQPTSTYVANVTFPQPLKIKVEPSTLAFTSIGQKLSFTVTVEGGIGDTIASAALVWDDGTHQVRSPIVVYSTLIFSS